MHTESKLSLLFTTTTVYKPAVYRCDNAWQQQNAESKLSSNARRVKAMLLAATTAERASVHTIINSNADLRAQPVHTDWKRNSLPQLLHMIPQSILSQSWITTMQPQRYAGDEGKKVVKRNEVFRRSCHSLMTMTEQISALSASSWALALTCAFAAHNEPAAPPFSGQFAHFPERNMRVLSMEINVLCVYRGLKTVFLVF